MVVHISFLMKLIWLRSSLQCINFWENNGQDACPIEIPHGLDPVAISEHKLELMADSFTGDVAQFFCVSPERLKRVLFVLKIERVF